MLNFEHQNAHYFQRRQNVETGQYLLFKYYEMPPFKEGMGCKYLQSQKILTFKNALFTKISEKRPIFEQKLKYFQLNSKLPPDIAH